MTVPVANRQPYTQTTVVLLGASLVAWVVTIGWTRSTDMGAMPGTMGMGLFGFTAMWAIMMSAMMLPSVGPFIGVYQRTVTENRGIRITALATGYLGVWAVIGIVAFQIAGWFGDLAGQHATVAHMVAVATFGSVGAYQLTGLKLRCLSHCRSPLGHLIHYLSYKGALRDLRAGASHGSFCLGCCWALMVLMVAFGVMNITAMIGLSIIIGVEKVWRHGVRFAQAVGVASLLYAVALIFAPELAPGLDPTAAVPMGAMGM